MSQENPTGMTIEQRLVGLGITLPPAPRAAGLYEPCVEASGLLYISGTLPVRDGELPKKGKLGVDVTPDEGYELAGICALNALAAAKAYLGNLNRIRRAVRVTGYVASGEAFIQHPHVVNGASQVLHDVFGAQGRHARTAIGVAELPLESPVEVEFIFALASD